MYLHVKILNVLTSLSSVRLQMLLSDLFHLCLPSVQISQIVLHVLTLMVLHADSGSFPCCCFAC